MGLFDSFRSFFGGSAPSAPAPSKPAGSDGVAALSGFLVSNERNPKLQGQSKWKTYDNTIANTSIVAAAVMVRGWLLGSAKWSLVANEKGKDKGQRGVDIVQEGLLDATMDKPWRNVVRRQGMKVFRGFALHEGIIRKRADGRIVYGEIADRPQSTIYRWDKPDEQKPWIGVEQQTQLGTRFYIPRERLFYSVEDTTTSSPDGVGMLRYIAELAETLTRYRQLEGIGFDGDLRGMPIGWAPLAKLKAQAKAANVADADVGAYILAQTKFLRDILANYIKMPNQSLLMDSVPYIQTDDKGTISSLREWGFELVKSTAGSMPELRNAMGGLNRDIARVLGVEHLMMGDGEGARAVHEDKTDMLEMGCASTLNDIVDDANRDLAPRLIALNGLDPEVDTPRMMARLDRNSVEAAARMLQLVAQAGMPLNPASEADVLTVNTLHERLDLPPRECADDVDSMIGGGNPNGRGQPPDPSKGEVDIEVDDLGDKVMPAGKPKLDAKPKQPVKKPAGGKR